MMALELNRVVHLVEDCEADSLAFARALHSIAPDASLLQWKRVGDVLRSLDQSCVRPPGIFFIDLGLPGLDGHQLLRHLREHPQTRLDPVIMMSGSHRESNTVRSFRLGAQGHLLKPVDARKLQQMLHRCLSYWLECSLLP
ncbi:MAG: response regulator [Candidatus Eremiobacteraeota bacterium]|nr:response regulator [Candidatus Eremiobacteraeota bacterium]